MPYDSQHWDWGVGYCRLHRGQGVPCPICIEQQHPDLTMALPEPTTITCIKPDQPPVSLLRDVAEGIHPVMTDGPNIQNIRKPYCRRCKKTVETIQSPDTSNRLCVICYSAVEYDFKLTGPIELKHPLSPAGISHLQSLDFSGAEVAVAALSEEKSHTARLQKSNGEWVNFPMSPTDLHQSVMFQIAQEKGYNYEQWIESQQSLRREAKDRAFGRLYGDHALSPGGNAWAATYPSPLYKSSYDADSFFGRDLLNHFNNLFKRWVEGKVLAVPVKNIFFRDPPRISSNEHEMLDRVKADGKILEPIKVRSIGPMAYEVVEGSRRLYWAKVLGFETIPAQLSEVTPASEPFKKYFRQYRRMRNDKLPEQPNPCGEIPLP